MTRKDQRRFIRELIGNVKADILKQVPLMPDTWDGHELRQFIADRFAESSFTLKEQRGRYREYKNTVLVMGRR